MLNAVSRTFRGHTTLTQANKNEKFAVKLRATLTDGRTPVVDLTTVHATETTDEIIGVYDSNPGHEVNDVSILVSGEFEVQVNEAITAAHLGRGVVSGAAAGIAKVGPALGTGGVAKSGFGRIIGGRTEGTKHFARLLVV